MRFILLIITVLLFTFAFPATAQGGAITTVCDLTTTETEAAAETLATYQAQLDELQTRLDRFIELQNAPAATRLMEWGVFADYRQFASADTLPSCGDYAAALTAYRGIIQHVYALSAQLQVNLNSRMNSVQDMTQELLEASIAALTEDLQAWVDVYPALAG